MKIKSLEIENYHLNTSGIVSGIYSGFGDVVCLVGKNGSGKTRILKLLQQEIIKNCLYHICKKNIQIEIPSQHEINVLQDYIPILRNLKESFFYNTSAVSISQLNEQISNVNPGLNLPFLDKAYERLSNICQRQIIQIDYAKFKSLNGNRNPDLTIIDTKKSIKTPNSLEKLRTDIKTGTINPIEQLLSAKNNFIDTIEAIYNSGIQYMQDLAKILAFEKIIHFNDNQIIENSANYNRFKSINSLINLLLAKNLEYKIDSENIVMGVNIDGISGKWYLNDRIFLYEDLSDGEKVLFSFAIMLFLHQENNKIAIEESIIIIDEPETHLHPHLQILLIRRLREIIKEKGQLIIATHSIHIISALELEEVFLVENDQLLHPSSKNISKIVTSLVGTGDDFDKFKDFCFEEFDWGFRNFIAQCFLVPEVITSGKPQDPQINLFKQSIESNNKIYMLDFGAGGGRLGKEITQKIQDGSIEYFTYNIDNKYSDELKKLGAKECFTKLEEIPVGKFDFVILCNVLHEIPLSSLNPELKIISQSLVPSGFIVIIEDKLLSKGEHAHTDGFLIFTELELPKLLNLKNPISTIKLDDERYSDRILCCIIPKTEIVLSIPKNIENALEALKSNSYQKFQSVKLSNDENYKSLYEKGRISAFYAQQYMNASFALDKLNQNINIVDTEIEAAYDGNWSKFLKENLDKNVPINNKAPIGIYEIVIKFTVSIDGDLIDITPSTSCGYGMEEEVVRVLKKSKKWVPASINEKKVYAYRQQPVTFKVEESESNIILDYIKNWFQ